MMNSESLANDYVQVEKALHYLTEQFPKQPAPAEIAAGVGLDESHLNDLFTRWAGIESRQFLQYLTKSHALKMLADVGDAQVSVGKGGRLSGDDSRHDLLITYNSIPHAKDSSAGGNLEIRYGFHPCVFGLCFLAETAQGICNMGFVGPNDQSRLIDRLHRRWPRASIQADPARTARWVEPIFNYLETDRAIRIPLYVEGTPFQISVWQALLNIPLGKAVTYSELARRVGTPRASRAVGSAVGRNPIAFLIPCHRVIRKIGDFGEYGEGKARKLAILGWEAVLWTGKQNMSGK